MVAFDAVLEASPKAGKMDDRAKTKSDGGPQAASMVQRIAAMQDYERYRDLAWEGSFEEYLGVIRERPQVTRNAFQRVYDMVISYGTEEYIDNKKKLVRYNFFRDEIEVVLERTFPVQLLVGVVVLQRRDVADQRHGDSPVGDGEPKR